MLQLLTHPIWWDDQHEKGSQRLEKFFKKVTHAWEPGQVVAFDKALSAHLGVQRAGLNVSIIKHQPETGKFDTDANALAQRIASHKTFGSKDVNDWIFEHLQPAEGGSLLDLGCGTGKQAIPAAKMVGQQVL